MSIPEAVIGNDEVLVLDFGAQYAQLIARRVRVGAQVTKCSVHRDCSLPRRLGAMRETVRHGCIAPAEHQAAFTIQKLCGQHLRGHRAGAGQGDAPCTTGSKKGPKLDVDRPQRGAWTCLLICNVAIPD